MKKVFISTLFIFVFISCTNKLSKEEVTYDELTKTYVLNSSDKLANGSLIYYDNESNNYVRLKVIDELKNGKIINRSAYYENGNKQFECEYKNGSIYGIAKWYHKNQNLQEKRNFVNGIPNGKSISYSEEGTKIRELIYENGEIVDEQNFDDNGNTIKTLMEQIEISSIKTGFYSFSNSNSYNSVYRPTVIIKAKNISDITIKDNIRIQCQFIYNNEELCNEIEYLQDKVMREVMQPNLSKQTAIICSNGYSVFDLSKINVECNITINEKFYKKIVISKQVLESERIN